MAAHGIRFYNVVWSFNNGNSYKNTTEYAYTRRHLTDRIRRGEIAYYSEDGEEWKVLKIQAIETPMIEISWLLKCFTEYGNKKEREAHREQAAYVLRLVESLAARVMMEDGETFIER